MNLAVLDALDCIQLQIEYLLEGMVQNVTVLIRT